MSHFFIRDKYCHLALCFDVIDSHTFARISETILPLSLYKLHHLKVSMEKSEKEIELAP